MFPVCKEQTLNNSIIKEAVEEKDQEKEESRLSCA